METFKFTHTSLDRTIQSLRLVHLLPKLSSEGLIQCSIRHATTAARYACLSYRWGEYDAEHQNKILIDGKPFAVQRNLLDFLQMMQSTAPRQDSIFDHDKGYWIDALCIDQSNILERNHQVAQMGSIFSRADYVHVWLGKTPGAERVRRLIDGAGENTSLGTWASLVRQDMEFLEQNIFRNEYWTRAWVVQEIVLAKYVQVSLDTERFAFTELIQNVRYFCLDWAGTHFEHFAFDTEGFIEFHNQSLLRLLDRFQGKGCSLVHDRVFSLLGLCHNGSDVKVNYDLSRSMLAYLTLRAVKDELCICSGRVVANNLGIGHANAAEGMIAADHKDSYLEITLVDIKIEVDPSKNYIGLFPESMEKYAPRGVFAHKDADPDVGLRLGCKGHWLQHFAKTLAFHLLIPAVADQHGDEALPLSDVLSNSTFLVQGTAQDPLGWIRLSSDVLVRVAPGYKNTCIVKASLRNLHTQCSYQPKLCPGFEPYTYNNWKDVSGIRVAVAL